MKTASIDSSSAIILYRAGLFEEVSLSLRLIYAESVIREITVKERPGAARFSLIKHLSPDNIYEIAVAESEDMFSGMGPGERDAINLCIAGHADYVITDDKKGASFCRRKKIPHINALLVPGIFYYSGIISAERRAAAVNEILEKGRYSEKIIEKAANMSKSELEFFLCV